MTRMTQGLSFAAVTSVALWILAVLIVTTALPEERPDNQESLYAKQFRGEPWPTDILTGERAARIVGTNEGRN